MEFLQQYLDLITLGICLCIGYIWKETVSEDSLSKRFIPLTMAMIGVVLVCVSGKEITSQNLLIGMFSGLASTGLYEAFKQLILKPLPVPSQGDEDGQ